MRAFSCPVSGRDPHLKAGGRDGCWHDIAKPHRRPSAAEVIHASTRIRKRDAITTKLSNVLLQHGRALEWRTSLAVQVVAGTLVMPRDTFWFSSSFVGFMDGGLDEAAIALPLTAVAAMRMAGRWIHGAW